MENSAKPTLKVEDEDINITTASFQERAPPSTQNNYLGSSGSYWDFDDGKWSIHPAVRGLAENGESAGAAISAPAAVSASTAVSVAAAASIAAVPSAPSGAASLAPPPRSYSSMLQDSMPPALFLKDLMSDSVVYLDNMASPSLDDVICDADDLSDDVSSNSCTNNETARSTPQKSEGCKTAGEAAALAQVEGKDKVSESTRVTTVVGILRQPGVKKSAPAPAPKPRSRHGSRSRSRSRDTNSLSSPQRWSKHVASLAPTSRQPDTSHVPTTPAAPANTSDSRSSRTASRDKRSQPQGPIARSKSRSQGRK